MNKKIVVVLQIDVDESCEEGIRKSFDNWKTSVRGAYAAVIKADEVKLEDMN